MTMMLLLGLFLVSLSFLALGHFPPWVSFQHEWLAAAGACLIGFAACAAGRRQLPWPRLAVLTLFVAAVPLLQWAVGLIRFASDAVVCSAYLFAFALCMTSGASLVRKGTAFIAALFTSLIAPAIISVGMAATQWLQLGSIPYVIDLPPGARPFANLAQPNHLATLISLAAVGVIWLYQTGRIRGFVSALALAWLGIGLAMTQSRTGWLFVFLMSVSLIWARRRLGMRMSYGAVICGAAFFGSLVVSWQPLSEALFVSSQSVAQRMVPGTRTAIWSALLDALGQSPWIGYGWTQIALAQQAAALNHVTYEGVLNNSHNLALDLLLWNGVPLGLLTIGVLVWWFARHLRLCSNADCLCLLAAVAAVFLHALLEYPLNYAYFLLPVGLMMGALDGMEKPDPGLRWLPRAALALPLTAMMALLTWFGIEYIRVEESTRQLEFLVAGIGVDKVQTVPPPDVTLLSVYRDLHRQWMVQPHPGMTAPEVAWFRRVTERNPAPTAMLRYAVALGLNGRSQEAQDELTRLCFMHRIGNCIHARSQWKQLQTRYSELNKIAFPARAEQLIIEALP